MWNRAGNRQYEESIKWFKHCSLHDISVLAIESPAGEGLKGLGRRNRRPLGEGAEIFGSRRVFGHNNGRGVSRGRGWNNDFGGLGLAALLRQSIAQAREEREKGKRKHSEGRPCQASGSGSDSIRYVLLRRSTEVACRDVRCVSSSAGFMYSKRVSFPRRWRVRSRRKVLCAVRTEGRSGRSDREGDARRGVELKRRSQLLTLSAAKVSG